MEQHVDEAGLVCLHCDQLFTSVSNLCFHTTVIILVSHKYCVLITYCLVGLVVRRPPRAEDSGFESRLQKLALQWLPCQAPGVLGSALGLVSPVSVYCDWVMKKV